MFDPARLLFIDETAVSTNLVRLNGRAPRGERVVGSVPLGTWETITFVAALRHNKMTAPMVLEGAMTGEMFLAYVVQCLVPTLKRNDIVVMDNCRVHLGPGIREAIEKAGASLRYLPKYSPDLNPIEMPYSKFKTFLRKLRRELSQASIEQFARSSHCSVRKNVPIISGMQAMLQYDRDPLSWIESNTWCPRLTAAMILSGSAVQVKGFGSWLVSATKRLIAAEDRPGSGRHRASTAAWRAWRKPFDCIEPRARGRCEVEDETRVASEP